MLLPSKIVKLRARFERVLAGERDLVGSLGQLRRMVGNRPYALRKDLRERLCEMSFLSVFVAWEEYLECTFQQYLVLGKQCKRLVKLRVQVPDTKTAGELIRGGREFAGWANPEEVVKRAKLFFNDGKPYSSVLGAARVHLDRMRLVRNRSVHHSQSARDKFDSVIREVYGAGRHISAGGFLLDAPPPGALTAPMTASYRSMFELFVDVLSTTSEQIVPR